MLMAGENSMLAVIPARGGSKGVLRKNLQELAGRPLISWTVAAASASRSVSRLVVSTEDDAIASAAREWGAETPFIRPPELAQDSSQTIPVIIHAVDWVESHERARYDYVVVIQPTSPFLTAQDIDEAHRIAVVRNADAVVSVFESHAHPYWSKRITDDGRLVSFGPWRPKSGRRQDAPSVYALNGAIYLARRDVLLQRRTFYTDKTYAYVMPQERSLQIDTPWDLHVARLVAGDRLRGEG